MSSFNLCSLDYETLNTFVRAQLKRAPCGVLNAKQRLIDNRRIVVSKGPI
jgi:hypothetical protein